MHWRGRDLKIVLAWALASTVLATSALWVIRAEEQRQLERSAEQSALLWAQFAEHTLPDLEEFRPGTVLLPAVRQRLLQLTHFKDIFLYKIHDKAGDQVLASSDLKQDAGAPLPVYRDSIGSSYGSGKTAKIRNLVMSGKSYVELKQGLGTDRPAVYSEAFVPVVKGGVVQGVVEIYVDQTELAASTRASFARVVALVGGFLLLFMGIGFYQSWLRLRSVRKSRAKYQELAHADPLTGSMNRVSFNLELHAAVKHFREGGPPFALVCIDLDNFKEINDTLGHAAGDQALREAMQRITESVRAGDFVARLGGDEFAVLLMNVEKRAVVASMAHRLLQRLGEPLSMGSILFNFGGSAGIVMHGPQVKSAVGLVGGVRRVSPPGRREAQAEVAHDVPGEQADEVRVAREARINAGEGARADRGAARLVEGLEHDDATPGEREVRGRDEAVVAAAHDHVIEPLRHPPAASAAGSTSCGG